MMRFVDLWIASDSLYIVAIVNRKTDLEGSWNLVHLIKSPLNSPIDTLSGMQAEQNEG